MNQGVLVLLLLCAVALSVALVVHCGYEPSDSPLCGMPTAAFIWVVITVVIARGVMKWMQQRYKLKEII